MKNSVDSHPFSRYVCNKDVPTVIEVVDDNDPITVEDIDATLNVKAQGEIKAAVRLHTWGLRHEGRKNLWLKLSKYKHGDSVGIYGDISKEVFGDTDGINRNLPSFVDPSKNEYYFLNDEGKLKVKKIICIIGHTNPEITYAPTIFTVTSLLLHFMEEDECFHCICGLLKSPDNFIPQTKLSFETTQFVLRYLCKRYAKAMYSYFLKEESWLEIIFKDWIYWILKDLPFSYKVRIFDCFLFEGPKVMYRVALALINLYHKHVVKANLVKKEWTKEEFLSNMRQFFSKIPVPVEKLLDKAFNLRDLSSEYIRKLVLKSEMLVRSQFKATDAAILRHAASLDSLKMKSSSSTDSAMITSEMVNKRRHSRSRSLTLASLPFTSTNSHLLTNNSWQLLWKWLPVRITLLSPKLVYTTNEHGTSLQTFYRYCSDYEPLLIIIQTNSNEIFGVYCSSSWTERFGKTRNMTYFGTGETFIFTLEPDVIKYPWIGVDKAENVPNSSQLYLAGDNIQLLIGGGNGNAISLDENLTTGTSTRCDTFNNAPLSKNKEFTCNNMEVFVFV